MTGEPGVPVPVQNVVGRSTVPRGPEVRTEQPRGSTNRAARMGMPGPARDEDVDVRVESQQSNAPRPASSAQPLALHDVLHGYIELTRRIITLSERLVEAHRLRDNEGSGDVRRVVGRVCGALRDFTELAAGLCPPPSQYQVDVVGALRVSLGALVDRHGALAPGAAPIDEQERYRLFECLSTAWDDAVGVFGTASSMPIRQLERFAESFVVDEQQIRGRVQPRAAAT